MNSGILATRYCGVSIENPFLLASSPAAMHYDAIARALEAGFAGVVFKTMKMQPAQGHPRLSAERNPFGHIEGLSCLGCTYKETYQTGLSILQRLKETFTHKLIAASIVADVPEEWATLAAACARAGVDLIECNLSSRHYGCPDWAANRGALAAECVAAAATAGLPLSVKLAADSTSLFPVAQAARRAGATGAAAINVMKSIPSMDLERKICPPLTGSLGMPSGYSGHAIKPLGLRSVFDLSTNPNLQGMSLCGVGGIENWQDAADYLLLGCECVQLCTAVLQYGSRVVQPLLRGLADHLCREGSTLAGFIGSALPNMRADIIPLAKRLPVADRWECIGCGRCYVSCRDGGAAALDWDSQKRKPLLRAKDCIGCGLCAAVCPVDAIQMAE